MQLIKFERLHPDAVIPAKGTEFAAGFDLYTPEKIGFGGGQRKKIPLGFATEVPDGLHFRIESRSSLALRGLVVLTGVIDCDYRGEWSVIMQNISQEYHEFAAGDRVAQAVARQTPPVAFVEALELSPSARTGGFGSTGR